MKKAYRITMDYNEYSFENLRMEYKENKTATWYIKSKNSPKIKDDFEKLKEGIDVYIYCSNMPDKLNRFVFKGEIKSVEANTLVTKDDKKFKDYNNKIIMNNIKVFDENNASKLAIRNGKENSNGKKMKFSPQSTYGELDESVISELTKIEVKEDLEVFLDRFTGCNCELEGFKNDELKHSSFKKENNEKYIEFHHLIFRKFGYDDKELLNKLDSNSYNYSQLCPACHRAIHYGNNKLKKQMIDKLLKDKKEKLEQFYNECLENNSFKEKTIHYESNSFVDFIYKIYEIKIEDK